MSLNTAFRLSLALLAVFPLAGQSSKLRLLVYDPGHFHVTLLQKDMLPDLDPRVSVYAPLGPELIEYLARVSLFNNRLQQPTRWELNVHTGPDPFQELTQGASGFLDANAYHVYPLKCTS